jgi:hypothetical protein
VVDGDDALHDPPCLLVPDQDVAHLAPQFIFSTLPARRRPMLSALVPAGKRHSSWDGIPDDPCSVHQPG